MFTDQSKIKLVINNKTELNHSQMLENSQYFLNNLRKKLEKKLENLLHLITTKWQYIKTCWMQLTVFTGKFLIINVYTGKEERQKNQ